MSNVKFEIGDKIVTIRDGELRKGVVKNSYPVNPPVLAIEFEDGTVEKVFSSDVAPEPTTETPEQNEPIPQPEITITPEELTEITLRVISEETKDNFILGIACATLMGKVIKALFVVDP